MVPGDSSHSPSPEAGLFGEEGMTPKERWLQKAHVSVGAYEAYLWLLHGLDYPEDYEASLQAAASAYEDPGFVEAAHAAMSSQDAAARVRDNLVFILRSAQSELDFSKLLPGPVRQARFIGYEEAQSRNLVDVLRLYLVDIVGNLAVQQVADEDWWQKNTNLQRLGNPFDDHEVLRAVWRYADKKSHRQINQMGLDKLAPGYLTSA